jgi:hypothetical protein
MPRHERPAPPSSRRVALEELGRYFNRPRAYEWALKAGDYPELRKLGAAVVALSRAIEDADAAVHAADNEDEARRLGATPISDARKRRKERK